MLKLIRRAYRRWQLKNAEFSLVMHQASADVCSLQIVLLLAHISDLRRGIAALA